MTKTFGCCALLLAFAFAASTPTLADGACCVGDGTCELVTQEADCTGWYLGDGTVCDPNPCPQVVNISGATLFEAFFNSFAATNDFINVDGDFIYVGEWVFPQNPPCDNSDCQEVPWAQFHFCPCAPSNPFDDQTDQLAPWDNNLCRPTGVWNTHWIVNYRGVGSGNGLAEMREWALANVAPWEAPDIGSINGQQYYDGSYQLTCGVAEDPINGSPELWPRLSTDYGVMDVPTKNFVKVDGDPNWRDNPGEEGYGSNPLSSWISCIPGSKGNGLKSLCADNPVIPGAPDCLNTNTDNPDEWTVFDTPLSWVAISYIANPGVLGNADCTCTNEGIFTVTELQWLWLTGRLPTGENLNAATRDSGSGTRNGGMNSICIDPSWGRGDNLGTKIADDWVDVLGPHHQWSNLGGSSRMEGVTQNNRLAVGYTGVSGGSRSMNDAISGKYEILSVIFDDRGGSLPTRPTVENAIYQGNPDTGWPVGGKETFASVGDPEETDPASPAYMENQAAADYLRNINASLSAVLAAPGEDEDKLMPGEFLLKNYVPTDGLNSIQDPADPCNIIPNPRLNPFLRDFLVDQADNNDWNNGEPLPELREYSSVYKIPTRATYDVYSADLGFDPPGIVWPAHSFSGCCCCPWPLDGYYSDGTGGDYYYTINGKDAANRVNAPLTEVNWVAGDFNQDGCRNMADIEGMMAAIYDRYVVNPVDWSGAISTPHTAVPPALPGGGWDPVGGNHWPTYKAYLTASGANPNAPISVDVIGDFNGDGNFDCHDVRFFADGLALDPTDDCELHRFDGFAAIDMIWFALTGDVDNNFFNTTIYNCEGTALNEPCDPANPNDHYAPHFDVNWTMGASAADVYGKTIMGANAIAPGAMPIGADCRIDCEDAWWIDQNFGYDWHNIDDAVAMDLSCDLTNDKVVDCDDVLYLQGLMGCVCPNIDNTCQTVWCLGDMNCSGGSPTFEDILYFAAAVGNETGWVQYYRDNNGGQDPPCPWLLGDYNGGGVEFSDIVPFANSVGQDCIPY